MRAACKAYTPTKRALKVTADAATQIGGCIPDLTNPSLLGRLSATIEGRRYSSMYVQRETGELPFDRFQNAQKSRDHSGNFLT